MGNRGGLVIDPVKETIRFYPFGKVEIISWGDSVRILTPDDGKLEINGVDYKLNADLERTEFNTYVFPRSQYGMNLRRIGDWSKDPSQSAISKVRESLPLVVTTFMLQHQDFYIRGKIAGIEQQIEARESELARLDLQRDGIKDKLTNLAANKASAEYDLERMGGDK